MSSLSSQYGHTPRGNGDGIHSTFSYSLALRLASTNLVSLVCQVANAAIIGTHISARRELVSGSLAIPRTFLSA